MTKSPPIVPRQDLDKTLKIEANYQQHLAYIAAAVFALLFFVTLAQQVFHIVILPVSIAGSEDLSLWFGSFAFALLISFNLQASTKPDVMATAIYGLGIITLLWTTARTIIVALYLALPGTTALCQNRYGACIDAASNQNFIFSVIAHQNFLILNLFIATALWFTYCRFKKYFANNWARWGLCLSIVILSLTLLTSFWLDRDIFIKAWFIELIICLLMTKLSSSSNNQLERP